MALCKRTFCIFRPGIPQPGMMCHYSYTGSIPCTGPMRCIYCNTVKGE
jgi:hypothetical protein